MAIGAALIVITDGVLVGIGGDLGAPFLMGGSIIGALASIGFYLFTMKVLARRRVPELRGSTVKEFLLGSALGAFFVLASVAIVVALGGYTIHWHPDEIATTLSLVIAVNIGAAVVEELVFRGLVLQAVEKLGGPWIAIAVSAALFGVVHILNPDATLWSAIAIAAEAGLLVGAAFVWRRSLWFVVGVHFAWNTTEGLLGIPVSGHRDFGLFVTDVHGADWLTGGAFGLEASLVPFTVGLILTALMIIAAVRRRQAN
jgi:membrane protease YdiL (CAAX protease family)